MIDPTALASLDGLPTWSSTDAIDTDFARRAADYLRSQGLEPDAIAIALRAELDLSTRDAVALSGGCLSDAPAPWRPPPLQTAARLTGQPTQNLQLISH